MKTTTRLYSFDLTVWQADITNLDQPVSAIVSSDDNHLTHGGGVSGALWWAAGRDVNEWWTAHERTLSLGDVIASPAGKLPAESLLHAVTIDFDANQAARFSDLVRLYGRIFDAAAECSWSSIATPVLGTGAAGLEVQESAAAMRSALRDRRLDVTTLQTIIVVTNPSYPASFTQAVAELQADPDEPPGAMELLSDPKSDLPATTRDDLITAWRAALSDGSPELAARLSAIASWPGPIAWHPERPTAGTRFLRYHSQSFFRASRKVEPPSSLIAACQAGIVARNRVMHQYPGAPTARNLRRTLVRAAEDITRALVGRVDEAPQPDAVTGREVDPIHALHNLIVARLAKSDRVYLLNRVRHDGYVGTDEVCLLEHCLSASPLDILQDNFTAGRLREYLAGRGAQVPKDTSLASLARHVLRDLGFPTDQVPKGPRTVRNRVEAASKAVSLAGSAELSGTIAQIASDIETIVVQLVRFLCRAVLNLESEVWAVQRGLSDGRKPLHKLTLGAILNYLDALAEDIDKLKGPRRDDFARDFGAEVRVPRGFTQLAGFRNRLVHQTEDYEADRGPVRDVARQFLTTAASLLDELLTGPEPLFPHIIQVTEITVDQWGRKIVKAVDDEGRFEAIFTDQELRPGGVYLMRPLSNPLRVDPILLPVGDQEGPDRSVAESNPSD